MRKRDVLHVPVLLEQVLRVISPRPGQTIVDCTLGLGGHSAALLERVGPDGRLIALDFDPANIAAARWRLERVRGRFDLFHANFAGLPTVLARAGVEGGGWTRCWPTWGWRARRSTILRGGFRTGGRVRSTCAWTRRGGSRRRRW